MSGLQKGGVYLYRTRKPAARLRIPFLSTHTGYVGETLSFYHRDQQHRYGLGQYHVQAKDWADLVVSCHRLPLPPWKWLLRSVETLAILLTWPVYNVAKNRWNPRRITPLVARRQRIQRNRGGVPWAVRWYHVAVLVLAFSIAWSLIGRLV